VTGGTNSLGASTTYTAWDAAGRPTAANNSAGNNLSWTYNDSTRTKVLTVTGAASGTTTLVYDANGNLINTTSTVNPIGVTYSGSVAEVCR
jgi:YD repeat-containing protein